MTWILLLAVSFAVPFAMAEDAEGVAGCSSVAVDPTESLEFQQAICNGAEGNPETSCASGGYGRCSSPKLNDVLPDGNHCICIGEETEVAPTSDAPAEEPAL